MFTLIWFTSGLIAYFLLKATLKDVEYKYGYGYNDKYKKYVNEWTNGIAILLLSLSLLFGIMSLIIGVARFLIVVFNPAQYNYLEKGVENNSWWNKKSKI